MGQVKIVPFKPTRTLSGLSRVDDGYLRPTENLFVSTMCTLRSERARQVGMGPSPTDRGPPRPT